MAAVNPHLQSISMDFKPYTGQGYCRWNRYLYRRNALSDKTACGDGVQNPDNQIVAAIVEEDVAFAPKIWAFLQMKYASG